MSHAPAATAYGTACRPKLAELLASVGLDVEYTRAQGAYLYRKADGHERPVLDLVGGFGAALLGHHHPALKDKLRELLERDAPFAAPCALRSEAGRLGARLGALLPGSAPYLAHFTNDGAGAIEAALKHAYKVRFDLVRRTFERISREVEALDIDHELGRFRDDLDEHNLGELERFQHGPVVLALKGAFHGKTTGALKLTFNKTYRESFEGLSAVHTVFLDPADLHRLDAIVAEHQLRFHLPVRRGDALTVEVVPVSMVMLLALEVIQGEGGIRPVADEALAAAARWSSELSLPLLVDEIQTGCGRTGAFVAYERTPLAAAVPEYVTLGKALGGGMVKIGATMIRADVYDDDFGVLHTSTFAEDEIGCAVANAVLDLLTADDGAALAAVEAAGTRLMGGLRELAHRYPSIVREVRGRGLMIGIELADLADRSPLFRFGVRQGFLSLVIASYLLHHHDIRLLAPLTTLLKGNPGKARQSVLRIQPAGAVSKAECERVIAALAEVFEIIERNNEGILVGHLVGLPPDAATRGNPPRMPVLRPPAARRTEFDARVGFVCHPGTVEQIIEFYLPSLRGRASPRQVAAWWTQLARFLEPDVVHTDYVTARGFTVEVSMVSLPYLPGQMIEALRNGSRLQEIRDRVQDAVTVARELGDDHIPTSIVGLGAYTSIVTDQGRTVNDFEVPITTGNAFTAALMLEGISRAAAVRGLALRRATVAVVGAAGNIGSVLAEMLAGDAASLRLIGRPSPGSEERLERTRTACLERGGHAVREVTVHTTLDTVRDADVVVIATSSADGALIGPDIVKPGAIVLCASVPSNLSTAFRDRLDDFLVFDGGFARLPEGNSIDCVGFPTDGLAFGCLCETLLLGFDGHERSFARGALSCDQVEHSLVLADRYGFELGEFKLGGVPHPLGASA